jgi:4-diphosphocytidyl-2-C-methyl-D-erythritol kinase
MGRARTEPAPAKVNLTLRVLRRRADGYHDIESLVVFADFGDALTFAPAAALNLTVRGPTGVAAGSLADNLVLKAAHALAARVPELSLGYFTLTKRLPVAAGLGGGSADAAAALRLLARANGLAANDPRLHEAARATGADVPVCLDPRPRIMRGIGDILTDPLALPSLPAVLVNPGVAVPTREVFAHLQLAQTSKEELPPPPGWAEFTLARPDARADMLARLAADCNDLEAPAIALQPVIADVLAALLAIDGCRLARMSGSGATCFGLFDSMRRAQVAARMLRQEHPTWWTRATMLKGLG